MSAVIAKKKGQEIPDLAIEAVLANNASGWGLATVYPTADSVIVSTVPSPSSLDEVKEMLDGTKDQPVLLFFGDMDEGYKDEDVQPFEIVTDAAGAAVYIAGAMEGNFSKFHREKGEHTDQFYAANGFLKTGLSKVLAMVDGDQKKLFSGLGDPFARQQYMDMFKDRGHISLLTSAGEFVTFASDDAKKEFPWGYMSNPYDYQEFGEYPEKEKPVEPEKKELTAKEKLDLKKAEFMAKRAAAAADTSGGAAAHGNVADTKPVTQEKKEDKRKAAQVEEAAKWEWYEEYQSPPANLNNPKLIKKFYTDRGISINSLPVDYLTSKPAVKVKRKRLRDFKSLDQAMPAPEPNEADTAVEKFQKDTSTHNIPQPSPKLAEAPAVPSALLTVEQKRAIADNWLRSGTVKKFLDASGAEIKDPRTLYKEEKERPSFAQQVGLPGIEHTFNWDFETLVSLGHTEGGIEALALLLMDYRHIAVPHVEPKAKELTPAEKLALKRAAFEGRKSA